MLRAHVPAGGNPSSHGLPSRQIEIIDLTLSPPSQTRELPAPAAHPPVSSRPPRPNHNRERRRHAPYDIRDRHRSPVIRPDVEIIDLDELPDPQPPRHDDSQNRRTLFPQPSGNDFEVTIAHARVRPQPPPIPFNQPQNPPQRPQGASSDPLEDLLLAPIFPRPNTNIGYGLFDWVGNFAAFLGGQRADAPVPAHRDLGERSNVMRGMFFQPPRVNLNYAEVPSFAQRRTEDVEITGQNHPEDKPIKPAREGFTRFPNPDQTIGCSRCDQELGDSDDDMKSQVWMMKCGHCYCGECANWLLSQPAPRPQRGKRRVLRHCNVDGCKQHASGKKFIWEIYV
ncbi:hypothetical protein ABW19_dt0202689 [Dactylella cylindrospora]|nr:hypothetical protein ABW19_dt0202689 [Dactylella cylindrospora]